VHGRFTAELQDGTLVRSGTMIGPDLLLAYAHNVYKHNQGELRKQYMRFYPAINGRHSKFGSAKIKAVYYPEEYIKIIMKTMLC
jgi:V8-like Glu-specific endopeptidase